MRLSADTKDEGFCPPRLTSHLVVFLDGHVVDRCITADEEMGFVLCFAVGADGRPFYDEAAGGAAKEKKFGRVEIAFPDEETKAAVENYVSRRRQGKQ